MNNKVLFILIIIFGIIFFNLVFSNSILQKNINMKNEKNEENIKNEEIVENEEIVKNEDENEDDLHSEDIDNMFNLSEENIENNLENKNIVFLDLEVNNNTGRIIISLNNKITPKTSKNFLVLCEKKAYVNSIIHRVIKNFMIQGGDFTNYDGTADIESNPINMLYIYIYILWQQYIL